MKKSVLLALGVAVGDAAYGAIRSGHYEIDWTKFSFMFVFSVVLFLLFYRGATKKSAK